MGGVGDFTAKQSTQKLPTQYVAGLPGPRVDGKPNRIQIIRDADFDNYLENLGKKHGFLKYTYPVKPRNHSEDNLSCKFILSPSPDKNYKFRSKLPASISKSEHSDHEHSRSDSSDSQ